MERAGFGDSWTQFGILALPPLTSKPRLSKQVTSQHVSFLILKVGGVVLQGRNPGCFDLVCSVQCLVSGTGEYG